MSEISSTIQDYLSLIFVLERDNEQVVGARLAELLDVTPPTVTNTLKRMSRDGLVVMGKQGARLTAAGRRSARTVTRRHMLTEWMMVGRLPWSRLHMEAHNLEHAISAESEEALLQELGHPQTCPHGNPLPGSEDAVRSWIPLMTIHEHETVIIRRIHELAEQNVELMAFLESKDVVPDKRATILEVLPFNQTITLTIDDKTATLSFASARHVFVERPGT
jgi:DtxR family transcriptional regulator, Mn-dependent transcriptional regulator